MSEMSDQTLNGMAAGFCGQLKSFVTCLHSNTSQLRASISQKPPAYGDLSSFLLDFNDRVAEDSAQMDLLEEMTVENVSFEELLAHCMELYKQNENSISSLESQLEQFGYSKGETVADGEEKQALDVSFVEGLKQRVRAKEASPTGSIESREDILGTRNADLLFYSSSNSSSRSYAQFETIRSSAPRGRLQSHLASFQSPLPSAVAQSKLDSDDMLKLGESFSLEDFGISASSLASLSRLDPITPERTDFPNDQTQTQQETAPKALSENGSNDMDESCGSSPPNSPTCKGSDQSLGSKSQSSLPLLALVTNEEYDQVLPWLKKRVSLEELNDIIVKINDAFHINQSTSVGRTKVDGKHLELEEPFLLSLGSKMKSCLLILVQIDRLVVACRNACTFYRPSELAKFR